jgi:multiphosphoryl transfer protein
MAAHTGLVVVSHSRALADAAVALAREMLHGSPVRVEVAAGLDDTTFGTDATQIMTAIEAADQGQGVVVLMDLGSALLSAELALELLDEDVRARVVLCPAPLVEGLVVAAVAAAAGADRDEVGAEAAGALAGKTAHLAAADPQTPPETQAAAAPGPPLDTAAAAVPDPAAGAAAPDVLTGTFTVGNPHGLHARPAARLVQAVRTHDARVLIRNRTTGSAWVPAGSLSKVATLGVLSGHEVEVRAGGAEAREALDSLLELAGRNFDEPTGGTPAPAPAVVSTAPIPTAPGVGVGPAWSPQLAPIDLTGVRAGEPADEWRRLGESIAAVRRSVSGVRARAVREVGEAEAAIFDAHLLLLDDADLLDDVRGRVDGGQSAAAAWSAAAAAVAAEFADMADPYLQARAADVAAVRDAVLRELLGLAHRAAAPSGVVVAGDLTPAEAAELDPAQVVAVVLAYGTPTAHSAILLRARGIPTVVGAGADVLDIADGTLLAVDGGTGEIVVDPPPQVQERFRAKAADLARRRSAALADAAAPARTGDGVAVHVGANVGSADDARLAAECGADLAGLVRTEFLFLDRAQAPDVDEQEAVYRAIAEALPGRRITFRTLDVGGDKPLAYLPMPAEANPFLGLRGIRLSLAHPTLLAHQLTALVRVAHDRPTSVMFPMVSTLDELAAARRMLDDAITLVGRGTPNGLEVGMMVEVPAAALKAPVFAPHVDFFSIGTNDLTQYALAAERGNAAVADVGDAYDPGVLKLVEAVCRAAATTGATVAVCGELAADDRATALLVGLGVRELSVTPRAVPAVKQRVRGLDSAAAATLAAAALATDGANAVRGLLNG